MIVYKSCTKIQLSKDADVSMSVFRKWCAQLEEQMKPFGYSRRSKVLNPACVRVIAEYFCFFPHNATVI